MSYFEKHSSSPCKFFCQFCNLGFPAQGRVNKDAKVFYIFSTIQRLRTKLDSHKFINSF